MADAPVSIKAGNITSQTIHTRVTNLHIPLYKLSIGKDRELM